MSQGRDQVIALAGVSQAALWAHRLANQGLYDLQRVERAVDSVLCTNPESAADVFGGTSNSRIPGIVEGLPVLRAQLGDASSVLSRAELIPVTRHFGHFLKIATRLQRNKAILKDVSMGIERARVSAQTLGSTNDSTISSLAETYTRTISHINPRILVHGNPRHLQNEGFVRTIRVFLLSGVRSGVLWRQCGGRLWHLLLTRRTLLEAARTL